MVGQSKRCVLQRCILLCALIFLCSSVTAAVAPVIPLPDAGIPGTVRPVINTRISAPSGFSVQPVSATEIQLQWTTDLTAFGYVLFESVDGSSYTFLASIFPNTKTSYSASVTPGSSYSFLLFSFSGAGFSASTTVAYAAPNLPATPAAFDAIVANASIPTVNLSWSSSDPTVTHFELARANAGTGNFVDLDSNIPAAQRAFSDNTVTSGNSYDYRLIAYNGVVASNPAQLSGITVQNIIVPPLAATDLTAGEVTSAANPLAWRDNSNNEDSFLIQRRETTLGVPSPFTTIASLAANTVTFTDSAATGMQPGIHYEYQVDAVNSAGSASSNIIAVVIPPKDSNAFLSYLNKNAPRFQENAETAIAYYKAIDPTDSKTTLNDWKRLNGFGTGGSQDKEAVYVNDADLGFARRMYVNPNVNGTGAVASYVENYATLDAAIAGNEAGIIATVAMEYTQPMLTPQEIAAKKVVLTNSKFQHQKVQESFSSTLNGVKAGVYEVVVGALDAFGDVSEPYDFSISDVASPVASLVGPFVEQHWNMKRFDNVNNIGPAGAGGDYSGEHYRFTLDTPRDIQVKLATRWPATVVFKRLYEQLGQNSAAALGDTATLSLNLEPGEYVAVIGSHAYLGELGGLFDATYSLDLTGSSLSDLPEGTIGATVGSSLNFTGRMALGANESAANPINTEHHFFVTGTGIQAVTLTVTMTNSANTTLPSLALLQGNGAWVPNPVNPVLRVSPDIATLSNVPPKFLPDRSPNPAFFDSNRLRANVPAGDYEVAFTIPYFDQAWNFNVQLRDPITPANLLSCNNPTPTGFVNSEGPNPYFSGNPRCQLSFNQPQALEVSVSGNTAARLDTVAQLLGHPGDFRHVVAYGGAFSGPYTALLNKTLVAGRYSIVATTLNAYNKGTIHLQASVDGNIQVDSNTVIPAVGLNSPGATIFVPPEQISTVDVPTGGGLLDVSLQAVDGTFPVVIYLLDNSGNVIDQANSDQNMVTTNDVDVLPGEYQLVFTNGLGFGSTPFRMDIELTDDSGTTTSSINGETRPEDQRNPYSPNTTRMSFPKIVKPSHVKFTLHSKGRVNFYLLGKGDRKIVTFYTFIGAKGAANNAALTPGQRVLSANLDGRGEKFQPGLCNVCHGGAPKALVNGVYPDHGDTNAGFLAWDMDLFKYDTTPGSQYSRTALHDQMREFNRTVLSIQNGPVSYGNQNDATAVFNQMRIPARTEMIYGWYGGPTLPNTFDGNFVPPTWRSGTPDGQDLSGNINAFVPNGADELYLKVVKPTCRLCHVQRETLTKRSGSEYEAPITFRKYRDFVAYKNEIEDLVYDRAKMPLALRTFNHFWEQGAADALAKGLELDSPFGHYDSDGNVLTPGRPIAAAPYLATISPEYDGADLNRYVATNALVTLNGASSEFAEGGFKWSIVSQPAGSLATLTNPNTVNPSFTSDVAGTYTVQLIVNNGSIDSAPAFIDVVAEDGFIPVSFTNDIVPHFERLGYGGYRALQTSPTIIHEPLGACVQCHSKKEEYPLYADPTSLTHGANYNLSNFLWSMSGSPNELHTNLLDRINFDNPLESRILHVASEAHHKNKAHGNHGWGMDSYGFDPAAGVDWRNFETMLRWIQQGAPQN